jgi:uncharacterized membrane protein
MPRDTPDDRRVLSLALGTVLVLGVAGLVVFVAAPVPATPPLTEFYVVNATGTAAGYPDNVTVDRQVAVTVGIVNDEHRRVTYDLVVRSNETTFDRRTVTLADGATWERLVSLSFDEPGEYRVSFLLYRDGPGGEPYREARLVIRVNPR